MNWFITWPQKPVLTQLMDENEQRMMDEVF